MHVEWYYEDFSDPEAVSGSSTNIVMQNAAPAVFCCPKVFVLYKKFPVENSANYNKFSIQKRIDLSGFRAYNRGSSWTKKLFKNQK